MVESESLLLISAMVFLNIAIILIIGITLGRLRRRRRNPRNPRDGIQQIIDRHSIKKD